MDFRGIRPYHGDKRKGFEELVCQLARREMVGDARFYRRVEGTGGDGGVEAYWLLEDGSKYGYQAKYFVSTKDISWSQIDDSVKVAIEQNPTLRKYTIALACDLTDRSGKLNKGKTGWEHWTTHNVKWQEWADAKGINVEFIPWTKSEIVDRLVSSSSNHGLTLYWFNTKLFDMPWFNDSFERSKADLGERFQPQDHVEVEIQKAFDGLARSPAYLKYLSKWFCSVPKTGELASVLGEINDSTSKTLLQELETLIIGLQKIGESVSAYHANPYPLQNWKEVIISTFEAVQTIGEWLDKQDIDGKKKYVKSALNYLDSIGAYLDSKTPVHLGVNKPNEIRVESDLRRILLLVGEAGSGKSHLFADVVAASLIKKVPALLLLGQYFPGKDIRREFLSSLNLANQDFDTVLQALNAAGEAAQMRLIILIDALNEAQSLRIWPDQLAGFISDILKYEWLAIGISLRQEYEDRLIPEKVKNDAARIECRGIQTQKEQEQAVIQYFEKRGIMRPAVPWLAPEFSNFLFLKTCCDALTELGKKEFPRGLHGLLQVMVFYLDSVQSKLKRRFPDNEIPHRAIHNSVNEIAKSMATGNVDYISVKSAIDICEAKFGCRGPDLKINWASILASEGVLRRDHIFGDPQNDNSFVNTTEVYRFTYQRFSDHLIVQTLIDNVYTISEAFQTGGSLRFLIDKGKSGAWDSLWGALAIQIPERFPGKEILDLLPQQDKNRYRYACLRAFEQSLLWRSDSAFSNRTLELFNEMPKEWDAPRLAILARLSTLRDHPWNAMFLDKNLSRRSMPERDALWTVWINKAGDDERHPLWVLIRWSLSADLGPADSETLHLAAITLSWMLTSSNRPLRDNATKALISILVNRPKLIPVVVEHFQRIDDLYVMERVCVAVFGATVRLSAIEDVKASAEAIYRAVFAHEIPQLNINLRDYARAIIEYAYQRNSLNGKIVDIEKCRPPYKSKWPLSDTTEEEIERLAEEAGGKQILWSVLKMGDFGEYKVSLVQKFTNIPLERPRPLNEQEKEISYMCQIENWSIKKKDAILKLQLAVKEKHSSLKIANEDNENPFSFSYPKEMVEQVEQREIELLKLLDKEELEFYNSLILPVLFPERVLHENRGFSQFDTGFAKRWIVKRAYEYGWNSKLFPDDNGYHKLSSRRPEIERIGKKYQWLALFELLARLSDNMWATGGWPKKAMLYDNPSVDWFVRDIEPSFLAAPTQQADEERWWQAIPLKLEPIDDQDLRTWPFQGEPPNTSEWIDVVGPDGKQWLLLYGLFHNTEKRANKDVSPISFRRKIFVRVSTILVPANTVKATRSKLKGRRLADPSGHETIDWTDGPFLCEYPWRNTWQSSYGIYENEDIGNFKGIKYIRTVARHVWESHLDLSLNNGSSILIPNPWIGKMLGLKSSLDQPGEFIVESNKEIILIDPTLGVSDSSAALIDKGVYFDFLKKEKLECIWIVAGEYDSWPSGRYEDYSCRSFASTFLWERNRWVGDRW